MSKIDIQKMTQLLADAANYADESDLEVDDHRFTGGFVHHGDEIEFSFMVTGEPEETEFHLFGADYNVYSLRIKITPEMITQIKPSWEN